MTFIKKTVFLTSTLLLNDLFSGHTQRISIPDCVEFDITTNACRGYCVSYSIPSNEETLRVNRNQLLTSVGQCCNIMETEDVRKDFLSSNFYIHYILIIKNIRLKFIPVAKKLWLIFLCNFICCKDKNYLLYRAFNI